MSVQNLLSRLEKVRQTGPGKWSAICPSHPDRHPSLSIRDDSETILLKCWAGCGAGEIITSVGLGFAELFPPRPEGHFTKGFRRPFFPSDVFEIARHEVNVVFLIGCDIHSQKIISDANYERLLVAVQRIERISESVYGR